MNVYYLSNSKIPSQTANSVHVMEICAAFAEVGHQTTLFGSYGDKEKDDIYDFYGVNNSFRLVQCKRPSIGRIGNLIYAYRVAKQVRSYPMPDLLYSRYIYPLTLLRNEGAPLIYEAHQPPMHWLGRTAERLVFESKNFDSLVVISNALREKYKEIFPFLSDDEIIVAHDAASVVEESDEPVPEIPTRDDKLQVGYVGSLYSGKGLEVILPLAEQVPDADFHIVGGNEQEICKWKRRAEASNLHFHGFVPHGDLGRYYDKMDVLLSPYQRTVRPSSGKGDLSQWMSPLKLFEYMSTGKAIVSSDLPVLREVLDHGRNAVLVEPEAVDEWAKAIEELKSTEKRERLGEAAQSDFENQYTWEARVDTILNESNI